MAEILIGTSGYDYPEWKGVFYPDDLKRKEFLEYYATRFNALELNNTFYNMPTADRLALFYERTQGKIYFSIKVNRTLTHEPDRNWKDRVQEMKTAVSPLMEKDVLSDLLFQLPQSFHYTTENRIYLAALLKEFESYPLAVEFRHKEWVRESVFAGLEERNASIVFCDMPNLKYLPDGTAVKTPFVGPSAYIRFHGRNADSWYADGTSRYDYEYSETELKDFMPVIEKAISEGKKVKSYFNNHPHGSGAKNGLQLVALVQKSLSGLGNRQH